MVHGKTGLASEIEAGQWVGVPVAYCSSQVERGQAERGQAERGQAERGQAERGQAERGQAVVQPTGSGESYRALASDRRCVERVQAAWPVFAARRQQRLRQGLFGAPVEKVAENILEDLLVDVLDWSLDDVNPRYHLPARCFAYVGVADDPDRWKLPYLTMAGVPDARRLPMAMQAILGNYRGAHVDIPRETVGDVLVGLGRAAAILRKLPCRTSASAPAYVEAHLALEQLDRLADVGCCADSRLHGFGQACSK